MRNASTVIAHGAAANDRKNETAVKKHKTAEKPGSPFEPGSPLMKASSDDTVDCDARNTKTA